MVLLMRVYRGVVVAYMSGFVGKMNYIMYHWHKQNKKLLQ